MSNTCKCLEKCAGIKSTANTKIIKLIIILFCILCIILVVGVIGYKYLFNMNYVDSVYNTTLTVSTLGIAPGDKTDTEKLFTGIYAVLVGVFFISVVSAVVSYIFTMYVSN
ncbi:putative potassium channel protein [Cotonvirus japonicus]|uniref:Potassium channel protein n=1 Tax=Cotonvirus japonicus TaxID=2811091 RepID=A0ABM7NRU8_9VIRU|nr:putative potassium channel protein [Cotonvirus japonicus]BCS82878.1 putative potassium channel protein [Cotonvirus japonicus]